MVKTRIDLKKKINAKIESMDRDFKTSEIVEFANHLAPNIKTSANRISKYIKASKSVEFNKSKKIWEIKNIELKENAT